ncbi:major facilitator superfamily protein, partial [Kipferlia bialata]
FKAALDAVPKLSPNKLIWMTGWTLMMALLDMSVVNLCLFPISKEFNEPLASVQWVSDGYSIFLAACSILAGKIGDRFGQSMVFQVGQILFMVCSFLCGRAGSLNELIFFRILQGTSAAILMANSMSISTILCSKENLPIILSYNSMCVSVGSTLGPVIGGFLTQYMSWRWCFYINLFIGTVAFVLNVILLPPIPRLTEPQFDLLGGVGLLAGLLSLVFGITRLESSWELGLLCIGIAALLLTGTAIWELKHPCAILPARVLKNKALMGALIAGMCNFSISTSITFMYPYIYQYAFAYSTGFTGFISMFSPIFGFLYSFYNGRFLQKVTSWTMRMIGLVIMTISLLGCAWAVPYASSTSTLWIPIAFTALMGIANSAFIGGNNTHMMTMAPIDVKGVMGGCIQTFRETGYALGISLSCLIRDSYQKSMWPYPVPDANEPIPPTFRPVYLEVFQLSILTYMQVIWITAILTLIAGLGTWEIYKYAFPRKLYRKRHAAFYKGLDEQGMTLDEFRANTKAKLARMRAAKAEADLALKAARLKAKGKSMAPRNTETHSLLGSSPKEETSETQYST